MIFLIHEDKPKDKPKKCGGATGWGGWHLDKPVFHFVSQPILKLRVVFGQGGAWPGQSKDKQGEIKFLTLEANFVYNTIIHQADGLWRCLDGEGSEGNTIMTWIVSVPKALCEQLNGRKGRRMGKCQHWMKGEMV